MSTEQTQEKVVLDYESPENYRMTFGEHLEELRYRLILALGGFFAAAILCMVFGEHVVAFFCRPLFDKMHEVGMNPEIYYSEIADPFVVYIQIALITAVAIASPWMLYQLWKFVSSGLYPKERKTVTKYIPLSVFLLLSGMVLLYTFVLPVSVKFFLEFGSAMPMKAPSWEFKGIPATQPSPIVLPVYAKDPVSPPPNSIWINAAEHRIKLFFDNKFWGVAFSQSHMVIPIITLPQYINMVVRYLIIFGICFQLPLVILALARIGIVEIATLRKMRRIVYFSLAVIAAFIIPDVVTGMLLLMVPLMALYEMGIFLAWWTKPKEQES